MQAVPEYPYKHTGTVFVCGNAWCLHEDLAQAREIYGDCPIIAINGASREVKAFALFSIHSERFTLAGYEWMRHQERLFGSGFEVHGAPLRKGQPWVDFFWPRGRTGGGSSSWCARRVAVWMGFDFVVLCGAPLDPGNYAGHRPGVMMTQQKVIDRYRRQIERDVNWYQGVTSMSGWTRDFLSSVSRSPVSASPAGVVIPRIT